MRGGSSATHLLNPGSLLACKSVGVWRLLGLRKTQAPRRVGLPFSEKERASLLPGKVKGQTKPTTSRGEPHACQPRSQNHGANTFTGDLGTRIPLEKNMAETWACINFDIKIIIFIFSKHICARKLSAGEMIIGYNLCPTLIY